MGFLHRGEGVMDRLMTHLLLVNGAVGTGTVLGELGVVGVVFTLPVPLFSCVLVLWGVHQKSVCQKCQNQSYDGIHCIF